MGNRLRFRGKLFILVAFVILFGFSREVNAAESKEGTCTYSGNDVPINVKLFQDKSGNVSFKYSNGGSWSKSISGKKIKVVSSKNNIEQCPTLKIYEPNKLLGKYKKYDYVIEWSCATVSTYCKSGTPKGYFDKIHNTSTADVQVGDCTYSKDGLTIKASQDKSGKVSYKYLSGSEWKDVSTNSKITLTKYKNPPFDSCPTNVSITLMDEYIYGNGAYTVNFNETGCVTSKQCVSPSGTGNMSNKNTSSGNHGTIYTGNTTSGLLKGKKAKKSKCADALGADLVKKIQEVVDMVRILVPVLLIVFGIMDFGKAIFSSDENEMKKCQSIFTKRVIIAIAFFLIPTVLQIFLNIGNKVWGVIPKDLCGIKLSFLK